MKTAVIIPTYDRAKMVTEAVESALGQSRRCAVVVVDDGSTDDTLDRLKPYGDRIRILARENRERGAARNAGAEAAPEAELLVFLDADDVLLPTHVEELSNLAATHHRASLFTAPARLVDERLNPIGKVAGSGFGSVTLRSFLLGRETVPPSATAIRRAAFEAVGGFDERRELAGSEDWLLTARILARRPGVRSERTSVLLRRHQSNTMQDAESMHRTMLLAHRILFEDLWASLPESTAVRALPDDIRKKSEARLHLNASTQYYAVGEMSKARSVLVEAARLDPGVTLEPKWLWTMLRTALGGPLTRGLRGLRRWIVRRLG